MKYQTLADIQQYLLEFRTPGRGQQKPGFTFDRVRYLARLAGDPQNKIKVIHVAGTSGKGSTCTIISHLLASLDQRVGLSISPHLYDMRERAQMNNAFLAEEQFSRYFSEIIPFVEAMRNSPYGIPTYYEIVIVLPYYIFWKEGVDYAVMETGAGGRLDATNIATRADKVAVITKIGLDHMDILGHTIHAIAGEKAAIIHPGNLVLTVRQRPSAQRVVADYANKMGTTLNIVSPDVNFTHTRFIANTLRFDFCYKDFVLKDLDVSLHGVYQAENTSIALATVYEVAARDGLILPDERIREVLGKIRTPGRFEEIVIDSKRIIIDGAHNPQKMSAFIRSLKKRYPHQKFDFLIGFKQGKNYGKMLEYIVPFAKRIYISEFVPDEQMYDVAGEKTEKIARVLEKKFKMTNTIQITPAEQAFTTARHASDDILVITGSLYLIGELYKKMKKLHY